MLFIVYSRRANERKARRVCITCSSQSASHAAEREQASPATVDVKVIAHDGHLSETLIYKAGGEWR